MNPTFNLPDYSDAKLITGNNIPVVGNGTPFTLTTNDANGANMSQYNNIYQVSTITGTPNIPVNTAVKISSDQTKSGIIADTTDFQNMLYCIRF